MLDKIKHAHYNASSNQQEQNGEAGYGEFELPIPVLVGRRQ